MKPGLLVSVRSVREALAARDGGATIIDIKEPANGSLGAASPGVIRDILDHAGAESCALGELIDDQESPLEHPRLRYVKWGLSGFDRRPDLLDGLAQRRRQLEPRLTVVVVAYADWQTCGAPRPADLVPWAIREGFRVVLFDTWVKNGSTLLDSVSVAELRDWRTELAASGVRLALAGSLGMREIEALLPLRPDWFAVRGAACAGGRAGEIESERVRELVTLLS